MVCGLRLVWGLALIRQCLCGLRSTANLLARGVVLSHQGLLTRVVVLFLVWGVPCRLCYKGQRCRHATCLCYCSSTSPAKYFGTSNQLMPDPKLAAQRLLNDFLCAIISLSAFYDIAQILARGLHIATEMCAGDIILRPACKTLFQGNGCGGQGTSWFHHRGSWSYAPLDHTALSPFHRQLTAGRSPIPLFDFHGCSRAEI